MNSRKTFLGMTAIALLAGMPAIAPAQAMPSMSGGSMSVNDPHHVRGRVDSFDGSDARAGAIGHRARTLARPPFRGRRDSHPTLSVICLPGGTSQCYGTLAHGLSYSPHMARSR